MHAGITGGLDDCNEEDEDEVLKKLIVIKDVKTSSPSSRDLV